MTNNKEHSDLPFEQPQTYDPNICYAVRKFDKTRGAWSYCGDSFSYDTWVDHEYLCRTTTSLLSAMFIAQQKSHETKEVVYVVIIQEPKTVWSTHHTNRSLELENIDKNKERNANEVSNGTT